MSANFSRSTPTSVSVPSLPLLAVTLKPLAVCVTVYELRPSVKPAVSSPAPPLRLSLPAPPTSQSLPTPPRSVSAPVVPVSEPSTASTCNFTAPPLPSLGP